MPEHRCKRCGEYHQRLIAIDNECSCHGSLPPTVAHTPRKAQAFSLSPFLLCPSGDYSFYGRTMPSYWLSTHRMTVSVDTDDRKVITDAPPIVHKFIGQSLSNLIAWMAGQGGFQMSPLKQIEGIHKQRILSRNKHLERRS